MKRARHTKHVVGLVHLDFWADSQGSKAETEITYGEGDIYDETHEIVICGMHLDALATAVALVRGAVESGTINAASADAWESTARELAELVSMLTEKARNARDAGT